MTKVLVYKLSMWSRLKEWLRCIRLDILNKLSGGKKNPDRRPIKTKTFKKSNFFLILSRRQNGGKRKWIRIL